MAAPLYKHIQLRLLYGACLRLPEAHNIVAVNSARLKITE